MGDKGESQDGLSRRLEQIEEKNRIVKVGSQDEYKERMGWIGEKNGMDRRLKEWMDQMKGCDEQIAGRESG